MLLFIILLLLLLLVFYGVVDFKGRQPTHTVSSRNFDLQHFGLRVSNPGSVTYVHFSTPFDEFESPRGWAHISGYFIIIYFPANISYHIILHWCSKRINKLITIMLRINDFKQYRYSKHNVLVTLFECFCSMELRLRKTQIEVPR